MSLKSEWDKVTNSQDYLISSDADREAVRNQFFETRVAPGLMPYQADQAREMWNSYTAPQGNPESGMVADLGKAFMGGMVGGTADLAQGATLGNSNMLSDWLREKSDQWIMDMSPSMIEDIGNTGFTYSSDDGIGIKEGSTVRGAVGLLAQGTGSLAPSMIPGMAASRGLSMAGRGLTGTNRALSAATTARNAKAAEQAYRRASMIESGASAAGFGLVGGTMMTGGVANQTYEDLMAMPQEERNQSEPYQDRFYQLRSEGMTDDQASEQAWEEVAREASLSNRGKSFAIGAISSAITGPIEAKLVTGAGGATRAGNIMRGMATEMGQEAVESGWQEYGTNLSVANAGVDRDPWENVIGNTLTGMAIGGTIGGVMGGASKPNKPVIKTRETLTQEYEALAAQAKGYEDLLKTSDGKMKPEAVDVVETKLGDLYRRMAENAMERDKAPTNSQLGQSQKNEKPDQEAKTEPALTPDRRDYVPADIDQKLESAVKNMRGIQSEYNRAMKQGNGDARIARHFESQIAASNKTVDVLQAMKDNIGNQQYFPTIEGFQSYIERKMTGGEKGRMADTELQALKQNRTADEAIAIAQETERQRQQEQQKIGDILQQRGMQAEQDIQAQQQKLSDFEKMEQQKQSQQFREASQIVKVTPKPEGTKGVKEVAEGIKKRKEQKETREQIKELKSKEQPYTPMNIPLKIAKGDLKKIGKNSAGETLYQDDQGRRVAQPKKHQFIPEAGGKRDGRFQLPTEQSKSKKTKTGRYSIVPSKSAKTFTVKGSQPSESARFGKKGYGGVYVEEKGGWVFPNSKRKAVEAALGKWSKEPPPPKTGKPETDKRREISRRFHESQGHYRAAMSEFEQRRQKKLNERAEREERRDLIKEEVKRLRPKAMEAVRKWNEQSKIKKEFAENATHIWTDPVTGSKEHVVYLGDDLMPGMGDVYEDIRGDYVIGKASEFETTGAVDVVSESNTVRDRKTAEAEAEDKAEQAKQLEEHQEQRKKEQAEAEAQSIIDEAEKEKERSAREERIAKSEADRKSHEEWQAEQQRKKEAFEARKIEGRKEIQQIKSYADEVSGWPDLDPRSDVSPWSDIKDSVIGNLGPDNARKVGWAKILEDHYKKLDGWKDQLVYADDNIAIFTGKRGSVDISYAVRQPDAANYIAWAALSGKPDTSPALWYQKYDPEPFTRGESYSVANEMSGQHPDGLGDSIKWINGRPEHIDHWKQGWRGAVTRPLGVINKNGGLFQFGQQQAKPKSISLLESLDTLKGKDLDRVAMILGTAKRRKGEKNRDRENRMRDLYAQYKALLSETHDNLMEKTLKVLKPQARELGVSLSGRRKADVAQGIMDWRDGIVERMERMEQNKALSNKILDQIDNNKPVLLSDAEQLLGRDGFIYTGGDIAVARLLQQDKLFPPELRTDEQKKVYDLVEKLNNEADFNRIGDQLLKLQPMADLLPHIKSIVNFDVMGSAIDFTDAAKHLGIPDDQAQAFGIRFGLDLASAMMASAERQKMDIPAYAESTAPAIDQPVSKLKDLQKRFKDSVNKGNQVVDKYIGHINDLIADLDAGKTHQLPADSITWKGRPYSEITGYTDQNFYEHYRYLDELAGLAELGISKQEKTGTSEKPVKKTEKTIQDTLVDKSLPKPIWKAYQRIEGILGTDLTVTEENAVKGLSEVPRLQKNAEQELAKGTITQEQYDSALSVIDSIVKDAGKFGYEISDDVTIGKEWNSRFNMDVINFTGDGEGPSIIDKIIRPQINKNGVLVQRAQVDVKATDKPETASTVKPGEIGQQLAQGETVLTATGRETTPFPKIDTGSNIKALNTEKRVNKWLMDNALAEAESRGDEFNADMFRAENNEKPPQASKDHAEHYLFDKDNIIETPPSILKPLVEPDTDKTSTEKPASKPLDGWRTHLGKARQYAQQLGIDWKSHRYVDDLVQVIDEHLSDLSEKDKPVKAAPGWQDNIAVARDYAMQLMDAGYTYDDKVMRSVWTDLDKLVSEIERMTGEEAPAKTKASPETKKEALPEIQSLVNGAVKALARQKRQRKRQSQIIEIDQQLLDSAEELANLFKKQAGKLTSGVDPVFISEVLRLGTKTGVQMIKKGAVKFSGWADNMLAVFEAKGVDPEQVAPHLKELYGAVSNSSQISDAEADQMDGSGTVRRFDMDTLLADEYVVTREDVPDATLDQALQAGRDVIDTFKRDDWYNSTQMKGQVSTAVIDSLFSNVPSEFAHDNLGSLTTELLGQLQGTEPITTTEAETTAATETKTAKQEGSVNKENNQPLSFGKHKGSTIEEIGNSDPGYIDWLANTEIKNDPEISERAKEWLAEHNKKGYPPLPSYIARMSGSDRQLYNVNGMLEGAMNSSGIEIENLKPDYHGTVKTLESTLNQIDLFKQGMNQQNAILMKGKNGATTKTLLHNWKQYHRMNKALGEWKTDNPERWQAYQERQKKIQNLKIGDRVLLPINSPDHPTGVPGHIVKKNKVTWSIKDDKESGYRAQDNYKPEMLRPSEDPVTEQPAAGKETTRGISDESGDWRGSQYNRIADSREIPPDPVALAQFVSELKQGDLFIDKFGNERGVVGVAKSNHVKLMGFDSKGDPFSERIVWKDYLPKGTQHLQKFKTEADRLYNEKQQPDGLSVPDVSKIKALNPEQAESVAAEVAEAKAEGTIAEPTITEGMTDEAGRKSSSETLETIPAGEVQTTEGAGQAEAGGGDSSRTGRRNDGATDQSGTDTSGSKRDSGEGADLPGAGNTSAADLEQRSGGVNSGASDFTIDSKIAEDIAGGGKKTFSTTQRFNDNLAAIKLIKELGDRPATAEQMEILARYVGWGGLQTAFPDSAGKYSKGWGNKGKELRKLLTDDEYQAALQSTPNAHYTTPAVVQAIYKALNNMGVTHGRMLEPSVGVGNFIGLMPESMRSMSDIVAVEKDIISGQIASKLYPNSKVSTPQVFEKFDVANGSFDFVVANPPFGDITINDAKRKDISGWRIHNYFLAKSMESLRPGGIMGVVVSKGFMDSSYNLKGLEWMYSRASLIDAYRLPNDAFKANANTDVTTDILFFQKREHQYEPDTPIWGHKGKNDFREIEPTKGDDGSIVKVNKFFVNNPEKVLGDTITSQTGMYGPGARMVVVARDGLNWQQALNDGVGKINKGIYSPESNVTIDYKPETAMDIHQAEVGGLYLDDNGKLKRREADREGDQIGSNVTGYTNGDGKFISFKQGDLAKLNDLLGMGRTARELIQKQVTEATDAELQPLRDKLSQEYDAFVKQHKALNREANKRLLYNADPTIAPMMLALERSFDKEITKGVAEKTGQEARKEKAVKADIFTQRTQSPYVEVRSASGGQEGLTVALSQIGKADMDYIADLTGKTIPELYQELQGQVFYDPKNGWVTKDQYLSGNVKEKLRQAQEMVDSGHHSDLGNELGTQFRENIEALEAVQPKDIPATDIAVRMGGSWQTPDLIKSFWQHLMGDDANGKVSFVPATNKWFFDGYGFRADKMKQWGVDGASPSYLMDQLLNNKAIVVKYRDPVSEKLLTDRKQTEAANMKAQEIMSEFESWIWKDPQRREQSVKRYNDLMNTTVNRKFDGSHLKFPGMVTSINLRSTQANAIWRMLQNPTTLLDHVVGAGKTFTMIGGAMELRRMGLAKKPVIVVPNHLVDQWAKDFALLYPNAKVLAASAKDFSAKKRKQLFARIATGDWDSVIVSHNSFGKLPSDPKAEQAFIEQQMADLEVSLEAVRESEGKDSLSTKEMAKARDRMQQKLDKLLENTDKDTGLTMQDMGIDALFLDEAHEFKNLEFQTSMNRVRNINPSGSAKASDMFIKVRSIQERAGGGKVVFATGTPISNSMAEMFTMQRYLGYEALKTSGLSHFDAWAKQFGSIETKLERKPSGKYEPQSRFAKFINIPELMQQSREFSDVVNNQDIIDALAAEGKGKHIPNIKGGMPQNNVAPRSLYQEGYMATIEERFANMPDDPREDNPLKATNDARKAALDMRMIYPDLPDHKDSKINQSVDSMMRIYKQWNDDKGTQLVFCDLSTPKGKSTDKAVKGFREKLEALTDNQALKQQIKHTEPADLYDLLMELSGDERADQDKALKLLEKTNPDDIQSLGAKFDVYNDVKQKLIKKGVAESEIAFIHDANTDAQKADLFDRVNSGKVRFLLGSTAKMGAGTNVQQRMVALHHLDAPWRPSDLEQREGRIIRQGNELYLRDPQGFEVEIMRYATEQTYDVNMWQTLEVKANFIQQIRNGDTSTRVADDVGGEAANAAEMKAASSGDPRILEQVEVQRRLNMLQNLKRSHQQEQLGLDMEIENMQGRLERLEQEVASIEADSKLVQPLQKDDKGTIIPALESTTGKTFKTVKEAATYLEGKINPHLKNISVTHGTNEMLLGNYRGFQVKAELRTSSGQPVLNMWLKGQQEYDAYVGFAIADGDTQFNMGGALTRMNNAIDRMEQRTRVAQRQIESMPQQIEGLKEQKGQDFKYEKEYQEKKVRNEQLLEELGSNDVQNEAAKQLPEYQKLQEELEFYKATEQASSDPGNELVQQVQLSRINRLMEKLKFAKEGTEQQVAKTVEVELAKIASETAELQQLADVGNRYSLTNEPANQRSYQTKTIQKQLTKKLSGLANVVAHESDLPKHLRDQIERDGVSGQIKGVFDPQTGQVYLVASHISSLSDAQSAYLHEAVGHKGLRGVLGDSLNSTLDQIYNSLSPNQKAELRNEYANQIAGQPQLEQRRIVAEEYLAHRAESEPGNNFVQKAIAKVRQWLRKVMPNLKWNDAEIRQLLTEASQFAKQPAENRPGIDPDGMNPDRVDTPESARYKFGKLAKAEDQALVTEMKSSMKSMKEAIRSKSLGWLGGRQLTEVFSGVFDSLVERNKKGEITRDNPLKRIEDLTQSMTATRSNQAHDADLVDQDFNRLAADKSAYQLTMDTMHQSTLMKQDPSLPYAKQYDLRTLDSELKSALMADDMKTVQRIEKQHKKELQRQKDYAQLQTMWKGMGDQGQMVYQKVRDYYQQQWAKQNQALLDQVEGMKLDPHAKGTLKKEIDAMFNRATLDGPYFPVMRHGQFAIIANKKAADPYDKPEPYRAHYESQKDFDSALQQLESLPEFEVISAGKVVEMEPSQMSGVSEVSSRIFKSLTNEAKLEGVDMKTRMQFMDEVNQITLAMLPELSAAKRSLHRKGIAGYDNNARRAFQTTALHGANRLARLQHGWQIDAELGRMDEVTDAAKVSPLLSTDEKIVGREVAKESRRRHDLNMNPNGNQMSAFLTNAGFFMYMGGSAAAGLVNLTQNMMVALPQMGSRHGYLKTAITMGKVFKDLAFNGKRKFKDFDDFTRNSWFSFDNDKSGKIPEDEIRLIRQLNRDGTIETTQAHTLAQQASSDMSADDMKTHEFMSKVARMSGLFFHNAEVVNRQVAALTAYRLQKEAAKKSGSDFSFDKAVESTRKSVFDAHFDYSSYNRPRHFKGNWAKVLLLFKQHSQNMSFILGKAYYDGFLDAAKSDPGFRNRIKLSGQTEGAVARRALLGTLGTHALFAGVLGLPGMSVMLMGAALAMDDPDDPKDPRTELRNIFSDWFGPQLGHALSKGVFNGYLGIDMHARTKLSDMWFGSAPYDMSPRQEATYYMTHALGGPIASLGINTYTGVKEIADGDMKGFQKVMPKFIRDGMKTMDYSQNGVLDKYGRPIVGDLTGGQKVAQALGFTPSVIPEAYESEGAISKIKGRIERRRSKLVNELDRAIRNGNKSKEQQVRAQIDRFNDVQRNKGKDYQWAIMSNKYLNRRLRSRDKMREQTEPGRALRRSQEGMRDIGRFAMH